MFKKHTARAIEEGDSISVLKKPPVWTTPRRRSLRVQDHIRLDFTEDPRDGNDEVGDLPPRRPSWRTFRRALRHARGPVLYARQWTWYDSDGPPVRGCITQPVAYLDIAGQTWVSDWSALDRLGLIRRRLDPGWDDWLSPHHQDLLAVMRLLHAGRRGGGAPRVGPLAQRLLGEENPLCEEVDNGWVLDGPSLAPGYMRSHTAVIGSLHLAKRVGTFNTIKDAEQAAADAIDDARRCLAALLAVRGGVAAELAAARARWPKPAISFVPTASPVEHPLD